MHERLWLPGNGASCVLELITLSEEDRLRHACPFHGLSGWIPVHSPTALDLYSPVMAILHIHSPQHAIFSQIALALSFQDQSDEEAKTRTSWSCCGHVVSIKMEAHFSNSLSLSNSTMKCGGTANMVELELVLSPCIAYIGTQHTADVVAIVIHICSTTCLWLRNFKV